VIEACREFGEKGLGLLRSQPGHQDAGSGGLQGREDAPNLGDAFARGIDHFREPLAQLAMMVHPGKTQVFERQHAQSLQGLPHRQTAEAHIFQ